MAYSLIKELKLINIVNIVEVRIKPELGAIDQIDMLKRILKNLVFHNCFKNRLHSIGLLICLLMVSNVAFSQDDDDDDDENKKRKSKKSSYRNPEHTGESNMKLKQGWFIGADLGTTLFYGDVALYNIFPKPTDFRKSSGKCFNIYGGKKFKFGLSAEFQFSNGRLKGTKEADLLYKRYFISDFKSYSINAKYNLSHQLFRKKNDRPFFNRLTLYLTLGVGQIQFRSRLYKFAGKGQWYLEKTTGFSDSGIDTNGVGKAGGLIEDRLKQGTALILPIGGRLHFKLNQSTNIVLDLHYVTTTTDRLDSWSRSWTHSDRYMYTGIGLMFNFGEKGNSDIPDKDRIFRLKTNKSKKGNTKDAYDKSSSSSESSSDSSSKSTKSTKKSKKQEQEDKELEIKLKLYELQLKLFEMQYLIK